jgi:putative ABC transport system permease protein
MLKNYFLIALRNIKRYKGFSFISIFGLAIGVACCILALLWVQEELSYDRFHEKGDQIYRVVGELPTEFGIYRTVQVPNALAPALEENFSEVIHATRYRGGFSGWLVEYQEKFFQENRLGIADSSFFEIFTFPFIEGNPKTALKDRYSVVLTQKMARQIFGDEEAMGKTIKIFKKDFNVTGVIKNLPSQSHIQFDYIFPAINMEYFWEQDMNSWKQSKFMTYIQVQKNISPAALGQKILEFVRDKISMANESGRAYLQPLHDIHLFSKYGGDEDNKGKVDVSFIYIFSLIAFSILLVACINFINLSTARAGTRSKEIGLRKVVGASRKAIIKQFLGESLILAFIALILALVLVYLFLPVLNDLAGKQLSLHFSAGFILGLVLIGMFSGIVSGIYPAFFLSAFKPINTITDSGSITRGRKRKAFLRKFLVITQFTLTIVLIIATTIFYTQLNYIKNQNLGFDSDDIIYFHAMSGFVNQTQAAKNELLKNPSILSVTKSLIPPRKVGRSAEIDWQGKNPETRLFMLELLVDEDFLLTFNIPMMDGRFFSKEFPADRHRYVLNETAVRAMGIQSPVGKWFSRGGHRGTIIGVIKDFHQGSLHTPIEPLALRMQEDIGQMCIRIRPGSEAEALKHIEAIWKLFAPGFPFEYKFLNDTIDDFYTIDYKVGDVFKYFTFLAIIIASLGLLGLSAFITEQRTREIGIRKVLGATITNITLMLSKSYTRWVLLATAIAWPLGWFLMNKFLEFYAYRITIGWWVFVFSGGLALFIALFTVSFQTIKAAQTNPADSLKYE